jgi:hypothetical protein
MLMFRIFISSLTLLSLIVFAQPSFSVAIIETDPPAGETLKTNKLLYVRLKYDSTIPLRFQAIGYASGSKMESSASFNPAPS